MYCTRTPTVFSDDAVEALSQNRWTWERAVKDTKLAMGVRRLAGSGIPLREFREVQEALKRNSKSGDVVLSGNLAFVLDDGLRQFESLSHPMAYEIGSEVYKMYRRPDKDEVIARFKVAPPEFVVFDHHLQLTFWPYLKNFVVTRYHSVYRSEHIEVFSRKDREVKVPVNPTSVGGG
jgi:hypothetical protein